MPILVGIDGTDEYFLPSQRRNVSYDVTFADSFVSRLCRNMPGNIKYIRGPLIHGGGLDGAINEGYNFILDKRKAGVKDPILLTGYSRGAVGVVEIARRLQSPEISGSNLLGAPPPVKVRAILLFDAVDRTVPGYSMEIPKTVEHVLDLRRELASGSRESFGTISWMWGPPTDYKPAEYRCTHAGMGGVLWPLPARRFPEITTLRERIPPREVPDPRRRNDPIDEGFPDYMTNVTYEADEQESYRLWNTDPVRSFIRQHSFQ